MPLQNILAGGTMDAFIKNTPVMLACFCAAVLIIAFCIGFNKGFRKVKWFGTVWFGAGLLYFIVDHTATKSNAISVAVKKWGLGEGLTTFLPVFVFAVICIVSTLVVYGLLTLLCRPKVKLVKKEGDRFEKDENGIEYDPEETDYDDYEKYKSTKMVVKKGYGTPSTMAKLVGGLVCGLNAASILVLVLAALVYTMLLCGWDKTVFLPALQLLWVKSATSMIHLYALDFVLIGIVLKMACDGFKKGFVESLRLLFVKLGLLIAIIVSFWLPFSGFAVSPSKGGAPLVYTFVSRCMTAAGQLGASAYLSPLVGRLICGALLCVVSLLLVWLINVLLKKLADGVENVKFFRAADGALSCGVYAIIGMIVCFAVFGVLYLLSQFGIFYIGPYLPDGSLSKGLFLVCRDVIKPFADMFVGFIKGLTGV